MATFFWVLVALPDFLAASKAFAKESWNFLIAISLLAAI